MSAHTDEAQATDQLPTTVRILDAAKALIEEHGEAGLRMNDLVDQSGTTVGSIYHFYGSREGVIEAVRAEQFRQVLATNGTQRDVQELVDALNAVQDRGELVGLATTFLTRFFTDQAAEELWQTFEIIGSARLRPGLRQAVIDVQSRLNSDYAQVIAVLQEKGLIRSELDARTLAVFIQAFVVGRLLGLMDEAEPLTKEKWAVVVQHFLGSILAPE
jgi:hypothetical protein